MHLPAEARAPAQIQTSPGIGLPHKLRWLLLGLRNLTSSRRSSSFTLARSASYHSSWALSSSTVLLHPGLILQVVSLPTVCWRAVLHPVGLLALQDVGDAGARFRRRQRVIARPTRPSPNGSGLARRWISRRAGPARSAWRP